MEVVMWNSGWAHHSVYGTEGSWIGFMGMHGTFMVVLVIFIIGFTIFLFRQILKPSRHDPALSAIGKLYAQGDIFRDEYLEKKKDLST
jgi:putative membrane protein